MAEWKEQRASTKFWFLLEKKKTAAETAAVFKTDFKDAIMSKTQFHEWLPCIRTGHFLLEYQLKSPRGVLAAWLYSNDSKM